MFDYKKLDEALDRNVVFFDKNAVRGEFTSRLAALMKQFAKSNRDINSKIYRWYVPISVIGAHIQANRIEAMDFPDSDIAKNFTRYNENMFGIEAIRQPEDIPEYYEKAGATWCGVQYGEDSKHDHVDIHLIIGETETGKYIIGSC